MEIRELVSFSSSALDFVSPTTESLGVPVSQPVKSACYSFSAFWGQWLWSILTVQSPAIKSNRYLNALNLQLLDERACYFSLLKQLCRCSWKIWSLKSQLASFASKTVGVRLSDLLGYCWGFLLLQTAQTCQHSSGTEVRVRQRVLLSHNFVIHISELPLLFWLASGRTVNFLHIQLFQEVIRWKNIPRMQTSAITWSSHKDGTTWSLIVAGPLCSLFNFC